MASSQFFMVRALQKKIKDLKNENEELRKQLQHFQNAPLYDEDAAPPQEEPHDS